MGRSKSSQSNKSLIHAVWTNKPGYTKIFTDRLVAEKYAERQKKYSEMVLFKSHPNMELAKQWIVTNNTQFTALKQEIYTPGKNALDVTLQTKSPLEVLQEDQEKEHPPLLRTCVFFSDCSKKPNSPARVGLLCKQLGISQTITLGETHNHQSGELSGLAFALEAFSLHLNETEMSGNPFNRLVCVSDSSYAVDTLKTWVHQWIDRYTLQGQWMTARREPVKFKDLITRAYLLESQLKEKGIKVEYLRVPREQNTEADALSNGKQLSPDVYTETPKGMTVEEWNSYAKELQKAE